MMWRVCPGSERYRYRANWIALQTFCTLIGVSFYIALPSLHQFVTSSTHPEDSNIQPGLGLSETWYSWIVSIQSTGELVGALLFGFLMRWLYAKHLMLANLAVCATGGLIFGIGKYGWMLLIGRFMIGFFQGAAMTLLRAYIGETSATVISTMPHGKRHKSTLKYTNYFVTFTVCSLSVLVGPGLTAIVAQIPSIDQFRWPGYFILLHAIVLAVVSILLFQEKKEDLYRGGGSCSFRNTPIPIYTLGCIIFAFFIVNWYFGISEGLTNPVLGDTFGFDVEYDSYVFIGSLTFFGSGTFVVYILQRCHVDNRIICIIGLLCALSGSLIACDWQALRGDPCNQFSQDNFRPCSNATTCFDVYSNATESEIVSSGEAMALRTTGSGGDMGLFWCQGSSDDYHCTAAKHGIDLSSCEDMEDPSSTNASCVCEAFSGTPYHCFWNPHSSVLSQDCPRCAKLCRSSKHSLNFVQFLVGACLFNLVPPLCRVTLTVIASDAMGLGSQTLLMGVLVAVGSLGRLTGPLWSIPAYIAANHHTYIVMSILNGSILLVLISFLLLYRTMKPPSPGTTDMSLRDLTMGQAEGAESEGGDTQAVRGVRYRRRSDQVLLLDEDALGDGEEELMEEEEEEEGSLTALTVSNQQRLSEDSGFGDDTSALISSEDV